MKHHHITYHGTSLAILCGILGSGAMERKRDTKMENLAQAEAFRRIQGDEIDMIKLYAADFRKIIMDYERTHGGQVPTADDLLWIESELKGHDITEG